MKAHRNASAQQKRLQIRHIERVLVRPVTPPRGNASRVEPLVLHRNFAGHVKSADVQLFPGIFSFSRELHLSGRSVWLPKDGANILEIELPSIPEFPRGLRKTDQ